LKAEISSFTVSGGVRRAPSEKTAPLCGGMPARHCLSFCCSRLNRVALAVLLALVCGWTATASGAPVSEKGSVLPTLTTARQAHDLTSEEAARAYPIHLRRAVVTYYDPSIGSGRASLFVHDATGGIYAELAEGSLKDFPPGTLVDVRGVSGTGEFAPIIAHPQITVIGHAPLPANPRRESLAYLMNGAADGHWVEVEGLVHSVFEYRHNVTLQLEMEGKIVPVVMVKEADANYSALVDAKVRVRASAGPTFNTSLQMIGVRLMCPNLSAIKIIEAPPEDPYTLPIIAVDRLLRWDLVSDSFHRVHLRGRVTLQWPGLLLCIRDATRGICAQTTQDTHVAEGDDIDVVGFVAPGDSSPTLTDAIFRIKSNGSPVAAEQVNAEQALFGRHDSELVQIGGQLIGKDNTSSDTTLLLSSGKNFFTAIFPKNLTGSESSGLKNGSVLRVTGICSVQLDAQRIAIGEGRAVPKSFRILMRSPEDVVVVQKPSWWTPLHALVLLALVLTGTLVVLAWVIILRKHVMQQAILLRKSEERFRHMALHDALTGLATRLLLEDRLGTAVEAAKRHQTRLALLMIDIDKFKSINDTYGHHCGDEVLRAAAGRLMQAVRRSDTVARMGGDEFVVLLPDINDPAMAESIAAKIVKSLAEPVHFLEVQIPISASVGVCTLTANELDSERLLQAADEALYKAKARGRNCYHVFTPDADSAQPAL
jgi:diguanylate cyclase (GGDEF)-like protein